MRVRMITRACGEINAKPGDEVDVTLGEAKALIDGGYAEAVDPPPDDPPTNTQPPKLSKGRRKRNR